MKRILMLLPLAAITTACTGPTTPTMTLTAVSITCAATSVVVGQTTECSTTARFSDGSSTLEVAGVTWQSSSASIATVGASTGLVTGITGGGNVTITATFQNVSGTAIITVTSPMAPKAILQMGCPSSGAQPSVCLANLEADLYYTYVTSRSGPADASFVVSFGDGQTCGPTLISCNAQVAGFPHTRSWFPHTYAAGVFGAQLTITDPSGQATATTTVFVKSLTGTWIAGSGSDGCTGQRTLQLTQTDTSLTGTYTNPLGSTNALSGVVGTLRDVTITIAAPGLVFGGLPIDGFGVNADASALILQITAGDPTCGQPTLIFRRQ